MLKKLIWLIKHQKEIEELLAKKSINEEENYSLKGVPEYQMEYINKLLSSEK